MPHSLKFITMLFAGALLSVGATSAQHEERADIVDTAVAAGSFNTLAAALTAADLVDALKSDGPFTVFAPTDEAFAKLPEGTVETLLKPENKDQLVAILTYHVVAGRVPANKVTKMSAAETLNGQRVDIKVKDGTVKIDDATVTSADVRASNGVIHVIDRVMLPSSDAIPSVAAEAGMFKTLLAAVKTAGLAEVLSGEGPFTVFAPTDEAFAKLPEGTVEDLLKPENQAKLQTILKYHVVSGRVFSDAVVKQRMIQTLADQKIKVNASDAGVRINDASIVAADIDAANGVIHVIDGVLLPPKDMSSSTDASDLIEMAINRGAPLYNHGQAAATTAIYEITARALLAMDDTPEESRRVLQRGLRKMATSHDAADQAWTLRYALDDAYETMNRSMASGRH